MFITRKIGSVIRGKATPFQIYAACLLGSLLGFLPGFQQAPFLVLLWGFLLLVLNANLFLAGAVALLGKLLLWVGMPAVFAVGRALLEGPTQGLFRGLVNAPVTAYAGLDYYAVAGGQLAGLVVGLALGTVLTMALQQYRRKMADLSQNSERLKGLKEKKWAKAMTFVFLGSGRGKASYEELMKVRVGNPIRIWGAAVALVAVGALVVGFNALSGPLMTSLAKNGLEMANGATVDVESVKLLATEGKLEAVGLAMADSENLDTNVFAAKRIVADIDAADLLRKRFSIDLLTFEGASTGAARATPGQLVGPDAETPREPFVLPDFDDIDSVLENSKVWKERLAQAKRWIGELSGSGEGEAKPEETSWKDELNRRIQSLGHAHVKADFLTEGSPTFLVRRMEAKEVDTPYLDKSKLDIVGVDLSTHPKLVGRPPSLSVVSRSGNLDFKLALGGAVGVGANDLKLLIKAYPVDAFAKSLKSEGEPPLSGGSMDIDLSGAIGVESNDLLAQVKFAGTTARIGGKPVDIDGITLPVSIRGPLDRPGVKLQSNALEKILVSAGKKRLLEEAAKKLGGDKEGEEGKNSDAKNLLKGILGK